MEALGERAVLDISPIILMKARKNKVETAGKVHIGKTGCPLPFTLPDVGTMLWLMWLLIGSALGC